MKLAHSAESHLGVTKTYIRLLEDFCWPRRKEVKNFTVLSRAMSVRSQVDRMKRFHQRHLYLLLFLKPHLKSVPNESKGVSSFELLFGRRPRTNLSMVKECILKGSQNETQVDASNIGFGGVLLQELSEGASSLPLLERLLPISYHSGFFKGAQLW